jgi:hypothetical protein
MTGAFHKQRSFNVINIAARRGARVEFINMTFKQAFLGAAWLAAVTLWAQSPPPEFDHTATAKNLAPSLVRVQYELQSDKGDQPQGGGLREKCPNCGRYHVDRAAEFIEEERPLEMAGFVIGPTNILTAEVQIHPRFIKSITVRFQDQAVAAQPAAFARRQPAVMLELKQPLIGLQPLRFQPESNGPFFLAHYAPANGDWSLTTQPLPNAIVTREQDQPFRALPAGGLIMDRAGVPVGVSPDGELPLDESWKGAPLSWSWVPAAEMSQRLADLDTAASRSLLRVELTFRSPKQSRRAGMRFDPDDDPREGKGTDRNAIGVLLPDNKLLVLASLRPRNTARLQSVTAYPPAGEPVIAKFTATLKDYGCFVATLDKPLAGALKVSLASPLDLRRQLLLLAEVEMRGEKRMAYFEPGRIESFKTGLRQRIYPELRQGMPAAFLFDASGNLLALPVKRREKPSTERQYYSEAASLLTPTRYLDDALANLPENSDLANVPLTEAEENRIAWLGVELQALNKELARANGVSDQTRDGETGALVTYVYAGSPAAQVGLEAGGVLLRLRVAGQPNPIEVKVEDDRMYGGSFPWERLGEMPEQYFDRLPTPWPAVENSLTRLLTDLGMGTKYTAEFFLNGQVVAKEFSVVASPAHYESADRFKSEAMGLTVRDLTYEVRRFLQKRMMNPAWWFPESNRAARRQCPASNRMNLLPISTTSP